MFWKKIFGSVNDMSAEAVREHLAAYPAESLTLLDVRTPEEYARSHLPGARLIPVSDLADRLEEIDRDKPVIVY